jgi:ubiquinone/menaquinone biosynthesis C-methylase UbiE
MDLLRNREGIAAPFLWSGTMDFQKHWSEVYQNKASDNVSWYQEKPERSLKLIEEIGLSKNARIIDVGAGASTLVDHLLKLGYSEISLLDISPESLDISKKRLGEKSLHLKWLVGDITSIELPNAAYELWHDRAVFHFLTEAAQQQAYLEKIKQSLAPNGHLIIATFASDGPLQCSGLDVMRYDAERLERFFGNDFSLLGSSSESHLTPWASEQKFIYCHFQRK